MTEAPGGCEKNADYSEGPGYAQPDLLKQFLHRHADRSVYRYVKTLTTGH